MGNTDLVSVIIPCYNSEKYIRECLKSVIDQSYENIEIIIVNDGSKDNSLKEISRIEDHRIRVINQQNLGACVARNKGIENAKGEYVIFLDSDDWLLEGAIEAQVNFSKGLPTRCVAFGSSIEYQSEYSKRSCSTLPEKPSLKYLIRRNITITSSLYPLCLLKEIGGFNEKLIARQEWNLNIRLFLSGCVFINSNVTIFFQRMHDSSDRITNRKATSGSEFDSLYAAMAPLFTCDDKEVKCELAYKCWSVGRWFALKPRSQWIRYWTLSNALADNQSFLLYMPLRYRVFLKLFGVRLGEFFDRSISRLSMIFRLCLKS